MIILVNMVESDWLYRSITFKNHCNYTDTSQNTPESVLSFPIAGVCGLRNLEEVYFVESRIEGCY
jgi:hypothetical protein